MEIFFKEFTKEFLPLYFKWCEKEHVKEIWFRPGYAPPEAIISKVEGNGFEHPFIIVIDDREVGYINYYNRAKFAPPEPLCDDPNSVMGFDLFIGEEDYLGKGYGTEVVKKFSDKLFAPEGVKKIILDPFVDNKRAIRCYEKAGFSFSRYTKDSLGTEIYIMEKRK